jgi:hypothetical protein
MYEWLNVAVTARVRELYMNAEAKQLIDEALAGRQPIRRRWLAGLGRRLSAWGDRLQAANTPVKVWDTQETYSAR